LTVKLFELVALPPLVVGAAWIKNGLTPAAEGFLMCARETVKAGRV